MNVTLPKIQAKLNILSNARYNYLELGNTDKAVLLKEARLKEAEEFEQLVIQYNTELKAELNE